MNIEILEEPTKKQTNVVDIQIIQEKKPEPVKLAPKERKPEPEPVYTPPKDEVPIRMVSSPPVKEEAQPFDTINYMQACTP